MSDFSNNNTFKDISIYNSTTGIFLSGSENRYNNITIVNTTVPITISTPSNAFTVITNSRLGNTSTWTNINRLNLTSTLFERNFYENYNGTTPFCIYETICDSFPNNTFSNIKENTFTSGYLLLPVILILYFM